MLKVFAPLARLERATQPENPWPYPVTLSQLAWLPFQFKNYCGRQKRTQDVQGRSPLITPCFVIGDSFACCRLWASTETHWHRVLH
jgi:hypothetical protein